MIKIVFTNLSHIPGFNTASLYQLKQRVRLCDLSRNSQVKILMENPVSNQLYELLDNGELKRAGVQVLVLAPDLSDVACAVIAGEIIDFLKELKLGTGAEISFLTVPSSRIWKESRGAAISVDL